ncbi:MAG: hypothetical protein HYY37_02920 [Candidatus Aenigmarchaeota archaeon]|nr:hypothetical protein [Candidatus Aenigmarchaeota archaeon]
MARKRKTATKTLQEIEKKEEAIEKIEERIEQLEEKDQETLEKIEQKEEAIEQIEERIEKAIVGLGNFTLKKSYLLETTRALAGAALGVSVGMGLRIIPEIAENLPWVNIAGILMFIVFVAIVLIYRTERVTGRGHVLGKLFEIVFISLMVEITALSLFNILPPDAESVVKVLVVGLFPTMSGAITFRIMD